MRETPVLRADRIAPDPSVVEEASSVLSRGGLVIYPSDTVYGILCRAGRVDAVTRLSTLKGYRGGRSFIVIAADVRGALSLAAAGSCPAALADEHWPGAVTIVLEAGPSAPPWVCGADGTIALRVPSDPLSGAILASAGCPLVSTSANHAGEEPVCDFRRIRASVLAGVDLALDGGALPARPPSRVIRPGPGGVEVLREGG